MCYIMAFSKMISVILLLWILPSIHAGGQEDHFQTVHDAVKKMWGDECNDRIVVFPVLQSTIVVLQKTNNSVYILDTGGHLLRLVCTIPIGLLLSDFMSRSYTGYDLPTDVDTLWISSGQCYGYNLTLAESDSGTMIEAVTIDRFGGSTLSSYIMGKSSEFSHLEQIQLEDAPITELTVTDLMFSPELQWLILYSTPIAVMENGLLCYSVNLTRLTYDNSHGSLTVFPRQIFNCTMPLKLKDLTLSTHNIASLPAHAFGSAAEHLRILYLWNIGLKVIHKDAFTGMMNLQYVVIRDNYLQLHIPGAMIPPSPRLKLISYTDSTLNGTLNLTAMHIARKSHLQVFQWYMLHVSVVEGSFCSNQSKSELTTIVLKSINSEKSNSELDKIHSKGNTSVGETLPADVFAYCVSLDYISMEYVGLTYLPTACSP